MREGTKEPLTDDRRAILIVDDNAVERTVLAGFLKDVYEIAVASGGEEALTF